MNAPTPLPAAPDGAQPPAPAAPVPALTPAAFSPSADQLRLRDRLFSKSYEENVSKACGDAGLLPSTFDTWYEDPAFRKWWTGQAAFFFERHLPQVYGALLKSATEEKAKSTPAALKLYLDRFDAEYRRRLNPESIRRIDDKLASELHGPEYDMNIPGEETTE